MNDDVREMPATGNELVIFDRKFSPATLFVPGTMDPLIAHIRARVMSEETDPTTADGRRRIISLAMKVTRTKTAIDAARKQLVSDEKRRLVAIDAEGRRVWDTLDALAAEVRQPVTEYENREKARVDAHKAAVLEIFQLDVFEAAPTTTTLESRLEQALSVATDYEEFTSAAAAAKAAVINSLTTKIAAARKDDADRAELERLRQEAIEREQREREERAAAKAKAEAEEAARVREEAARKAAEAERQRIQREAAEREAKMKAEAEAKERAAASALAAAKAEAEKAEADRIAAERKAEIDRVAAEESAKRREAEAAERERQKIETQRRAEEAETQKREADKAHRARINRDAAAALVAAGLSEPAAKQAITAIAKGDVPNVRISY